jgi:5-methylcytosine-specific restriction protein B
MAQPFTNSEHGFSQRVTEDEVASGRLEMHLGFKRALMQHQQSDGRCRFHTDDGATFMAPAQTAFPPAIGPSDELRHFFARNGVLAGSEVVLAFGDPTSIAINLAGAPAPAASPAVAPADKEPQQAPIMTHPIALNSILYGPPGTGKTFRTAELAVRICDGQAGAARREVMARYEALRQGGRIQFVTFHQSYGYEDFVEGLRPQSVNGQISYPVRPGVFRGICDAARRSAMVKPGLSGKPLRERMIYKMSLGRAGTTEGSEVFQDCVEKGYVLLGWGDHADFSECLTAAEIREKVTRDLAKAEDNPESQARYVEVFKNDMQVGDIIVVSHGNRAFQAIAEVTGDYEYLVEPAVGRFHQMRRVRWLAVFDAKRDVSEIFDRNFMQSTLYRLDHGGLHLDVLRRLINQEEATGPQNFVLIIDEINRANMSKVFGELITLIEPDKREGEENALTVKLPYSGDDFAVPPNLYIVGTMNTADRSIALLDTALRRRFEFEELQPDYAVLPAVAGVDLAALLAALNERVEYLYDRDHTIGHAYFMQVKSLADLDAVFRRKVIPLLQEYFHEDWSKVRLALNDRDGHFIRASEALPKGLDLVADGYEPRLRYNIRSEPFAMDAYLNIYR